MGTGVLSLPATMAALGYTLGIIAIVTFAVAVYYSGFLLAKVRNRYYKHVLSYGDVAYVIHGTWFERLTRWLLYANWYSLLAYYITALTQSFQEAFWWSADTMCFWTYCLVSVAVLLPFAQLRTFHGISWLSLASTVAIVSGVALFAASYITGDTREDVGFVPPSAQVPKQSVMSAWNAFSNIIFSFQGQSEFLEMMGEQKDPRQFPKSLALSQSVMVSTHECDIPLLPSLLSHSDSDSDPLAQFKKTIIDIYVPFYAAHCVLVRRAKRCELCGGFHAQEPHAHRHGRADRLSQ